MAGTCGFGIIPPTYGDGMIFVPLSGKVQAFNAKTLESLWVYTDPLGGQPNCPVTYEDGYVYVGFWNSETRDANVVCLSVTETSPMSPIPTGFFTSKGGVMCNAKLDWSTGKLLILTPWYFRTPKGISTPCPPAPLGVQ